MQVSARVVMMLSSILCLLLKTVRGNGFKSVEVTVKYTEHHERNLSCHKCTRSGHGDNCLTIDDTTALDIQHCPKNKKYCMVERRWDDGEFTAFMRECAETCTPGCTPYGTSIDYEIKLCYDCCQDDAFCNVHRYNTDGLGVDDSGATRQLQATLGVTTLAGLCLWVVGAVTI